MKQKLFTIILVFLFTGTIVAQENEFNGKTSIITNKDIPATLPFFDNFDDLDITDYDNLGGTTSTGATAVNKVYGTGGLRIVGGSWGSGLNRSFEQAPVTYASVFVMTPSTISSGEAAAYFDIHDASGNRIILSSITGDEGPAIASSGSWTGTGSYTAGVWYLLEYFLDYNTQTVDFYVEGTYITTVPFYESTASEAAYFYLHNYDGSEGWWDEIYLYSPQEDVPTVDDIEVCSGATAEFVSDFYNTAWFDNDPGNLLGYGDVLSIDDFTADATVYAKTYQLIGAHPGTQTGSFLGNIRGHYFTAPVDFVMTGLWIPQSYAGAQSIEVLRFTNGAPPLYPTTTNDFVSLGYWDNFNENDTVECEIVIAQGDIIGIYGYRSQTNIYSDPGYITHIFDHAVSLTRSGMQFPLGGGSQMHDVYGSTSSIGVTQFFYRDVSDATSADGTIETEDPVLVCVDDQIINLPEGETTYTVLGDEFDTESVTDNCDIALLENDFNNASTLDGAVLPAGTTTIVWTATDVSGNTGNCSFDVTVNSTVNIRDINSRISIYPNPSKGIINIENANEYNIEIADITGRLLFNINNNTEKLLTFNLSDQSSGIYILKISNADVLITEKIILK